MERSNLTTDQARVLRERVAPMLGFLYRFRRRLDERHFHRDGKLYATVVRAYEAMHTLHIELHYQSVGSGVGEPPAGDSGPREPGAG